MDGGSPAPKTPYRDGKALVDIIPPDRRREKMLALIGASMVSGVALWVLGGWVVEALRIPRPVPVTVEQTPGYAGGRLPRSTLHGPKGSVTLPLGERSIVHVWLQGCSDCMPAFDAMAQISGNRSLELGVPIVNVAYGEADETWAGRYGVATNLVFDPGGTSVVKPLGIGTFTTLVIDPDGTVLLRDRPDRPGYVARVRAAVQSGKMRPPPPDTPPADAELDAQAVQRVISSHQSALRRTCWDRGDGYGDPVTASVTVTLTVSADGRVTNATSIGDNPSIAACIEKQTRAWVFPQRQKETTLSIPFKFVRQ